MAVVASPHVGEASVVVIDPHDYTEGTVLTDVGVGAILSSPNWIPVATGFTILPAVIGKSSDPSTGSASCCWTDEDMFRVDFVESTNFVAVGFERGIFNIDWTGFGTIEVFDSDGLLLESAMTELMDPSIGSDLVQVSIFREQFDIDHMLIGEETLISIPSIRVRALAFNVPEPSAVLLLAVGLACCVSRRRA